MRAETLLLCLCALPAVATAQSIGEAAPEEALLEFLGAWDEGRANWLEDVELGLWLEQQTLETQEADHEEIPEN